MRNHRIRRRILAEAQLVHILPFTSEIESSLGCGLEHVSSGRTCHDSAIYTPGVPKRGEITVVDQIPF
jgi:Mn-dependent DtxR family transcriptional regulator